MVRKANHLYFGYNIGDQDKKWAPHICCNTCATNLRQWLNRKRKCMPFAVPFTWREPTDHTSNFYFCMMPPVGKGLSKKKKQFVQYPNIPSAICPVPHREGLPVPDAPESFSLESDEEDDEEENEDCSAGPSISNDPKISRKYIEQHITIRNTFHRIISFYLFESIYIKLNVCLYVCMYVCMCVTYRKKCGNIHKNIKVSIGCSFLRMIYWAYLFFSTTP